jgi:hypothetical protein
VSGISNVTHILSTIEQGDPQGISASTLARDWRFARSWLVRQLGSDDKVTR